MAEKDLMFATLLTHTYSNLSVKVLTSGGHYFQIQPKIPQSKMCDAMNF